LAQTFTDFEILVVNDGSTDPETCRLLADYSKPKTRVIHTENMGVSAARNHGIREAKGEYILPLDADDRIGERYLECAVAVLDKQPEIGIVYCRAALFGELEGEWETPKFSIAHQLLDNLIFSAGMFRKCDWEKTKGYDSGLRQGWEDWDFWLSILEVKQQVFRIPEILFFYRIRKGSRDRSLDFYSKCRLMLRILRNHWLLFARYGLGIMKIILTSDRLRPSPIKVNP
jgi:glycosyltransferase involved in cell wall biosynthesis